MCNAMFHHPVSLRNIAPREGTETDYIFLSMYTALGLRNIAPREGTETFDKLIELSLTSPLRNIAPREGTETLNNCRFSLKVDH